MEQSDLHHGSPGGGREGWGNDPLGFIPSSVLFHLGMAREMLPLTCRVSLSASVNSLGN